MSTIEVSRRDAPHGVDDLLRSHRASVGQSDRQARPQRADDGGRRESRIDRH
jgi:hypothetical protein